MLNFACSQTNENSQFRDEFTSTPSAIFGTGTTDASIDHLCIITPFHHPDIFRRGETSDSFGLVLGVGDVRISTQDDQHNITYCGSGRDSCQNTGQ